MVTKGNDFKKYIPTQEGEAYVSAVRDFTKMTMLDPSFFNKSQEEQVAMAMAILQEKKGELKDSKEK